ncbi:hypothetical protein CTheo_8771 [Ceratobasidium theobromae]|uniref:Uncharacterized protein n=1 Tax=Ceratobasidium theobromae TaxID=1582974 RepID=A0A5N5Q8P2_9AGAM|nr:hypothetical protein CTheo_8771 [Ceratobasidium theobromae]
MSPSRRTRSQKGAVDYRTLSGVQVRSASTLTKTVRRRQGKRKVQAIQDVEMSDGTAADRSGSPSSTSAGSSESNHLVIENAQAIEYLTNQLTREPPLPDDMVTFVTDLMRRRPQLVLLFFEKQWTVSDHGLMCNAIGYPLTYETDKTTGEERLYDSTDAPLGFIGSSNPNPDTTLDPSVLEVERRRLNELPDQFGLVRH